jgi:hypothetical protein
MAAARAPAIRGSSGPYFIEHFDAWEFGTFSSAVAAVFWV